MVDLTIMPWFTVMQVYASTVKLLIDQELEDLGLCMGDRVMLQKLSEDAVKSKTLCKENIVNMKEFGLCCRGVHYYKAHLQGAIYSCTVGAIGQSCACSC